MADVTGLGGGWFQTGTTTFALTASGTGSADIIPVFTGFVHDYHLLISRSVAGTNGASSRVGISASIIGGFAAASSTVFAVTSLTMPSSATSSLTTQLTGNNPPNIPPVFGVKVSASHDTNSSVTVTLFAGIYGDYQRA